MGIKWKQWRIVVCICSLLTFSIIINLFYFRVVLVERSSTFLSNVHEPTSSRSTLQNSEETSTAQTADNQEEAEIPRARAILKSPDLKPSNVKTRPRLFSDELKMYKPLFIGVVTAQSLLATRAAGIYRTWGARATDIAFFSSPGEDHGLPVVHLEGVDDTYPPQKKVFRMLHHMYAHHLEHYHWFLRADDDVYVRVERLEEFLSHLDPSQPLYIGSPGFGKPEDRARLRLEAHEHYCMGGPGVVLSRGLLRRLGPHLQSCLQSVVVSFNEDVELGRCVSRRLDLQCTWSYQASKLFFMDYSKGAVFKTPAVYQNKDLLQALTVHSFKNPQDMQLVHQFYSELEAQEVGKKMQRLDSDLSQLKERTGKDKVFL